MPVVSCHAALRPCGRDSSATSTEFLSTFAHDHDQADARRLQHEATCIEAQPGAHHARGEVRDPGHVDPCARGIDDDQRAVHAQRAASTLHVEARGRQQQRTRFRRDHAQRIAEVELQRRQDRATTAAPARGTAAACGRPLRRDINMAVTASDANTPRSSAGSHAARHDGGAGQQRRHRPASPLAAPRRTAGDRAASDPQVRRWPRCPMARPSRREISPRSTTKRARAQPRRQPATRDLQNGRSARGPATHLRTCSSTASLTSLAATALPPYRECHAERRNREQRPGRGLGGAGDRALRRRPGSTRLSAAAAADRRSACRRDC